MQYRLLKLFLICLLLALAACGYKIENPALDKAMSTSRQSVDYLLKGRKNLAEYYYNSVVSDFRNMGDFCNMARTALLFATVDPEGSSQLTNDALAFAALSDCPEEVNIVNFLTDKPYNRSKLTDVYKELATFKERKSISSLLRVGKSKYYSDYFRSLAYRMAGEYILKTKPKEAFSLFEKAYEIDSFNGWTYNLVKDESLKLEAAKLLGESIYIYEQRLGLLKGALKTKE